jgi:outer membrane protein
MRFYRLFPVGSGLNRCNQEVCLFIPFRNGVSRYRRRLGYVICGSALCFATVSLSADSVWAQDKQQPPTDPDVKNTLPDKPPMNKQAKTPPPAAPAVSVSSLPSSLTLDQAIAYALRLQPQLTTAVANREEADERRIGTYSNYYPKVTPAYTYLNQYSYGQVTQFTNTSGGSSAFTTNQGISATTKDAQVGATFNLFDAGTRELEARQARQSVRFAEYSESSTRQTVIGNVAAAYFTLLQDEALVRVAQANVASAQNTLDVVVAQADAGVAAQKDILQARADFLNAQVALLQAQNNAATAGANLKQTIGVVGGGALHPADVVLPNVNTPITAIAAPPKSPAAKGNTVAPPTGEGVNAGEDAALIDQLARTAYETRPDIAASRQNVEVQWTSSSISRVQAGVQVAGSVAATELVDPNKFDNSIGNDRQINVAVSYPLFDGGFVRSQFRANQAAARSAEGQLETLRQQVNVEVETDYRTLAQARATLPASASALQAAQTNYDAAIESRKEGVSSIVDVITAQTSLVQAQTNYVQAVYEFYAADARLAIAVGQADKIGKIGATAPNNPPPVQFTDLSTATSPAPPAAKP